MAAHPGTVKDWSNVLSGLLDPTHVKEAEAIAVRALKESGESCLVLMDVVVSSEVDSHRQMAAVLFRQAITNHWDDWGEAVHNKLSENVLALLVHSKPTPSSMPVWLAVASLAGRIFALGLGADRHDIVVFLRKTFSEEMPSHFILFALRIVSSVAEEGYELVASSDEVFNCMLSAIQVSLSSTHAEVVVSAMECVSIFCVCAETQQQCNSLSSIIPRILEIIGGAASEGVEDVVRTGLQTLQALVQHEYPLLGDRLSNVIASTLQIANNKELDDDFRQASLGIVESCALYKPKQLLATNLVPGILVVLFGMAAADPEEEEVLLGSMSNFKFSMQMLDVLANSLPTRHVFDSAMMFIGKFRSSSSSNERRVALSALAIIAEGCYSRMYDIISDCTMFLVECLNQPDKKLIDAACCAVNQFSKHLQPTFGEQGATVLPALLPLIEHADQETRCHALTAIEYFLVKTEEPMTQYVEHLLHKLFELLAVCRNGGDALTQAAAICCISAVVLAGGDDIAPFAAKILETMSGYLDQKENLLLRARGMECIGMTVIAAGGDYLGNHAGDIIKLALEGLTLAGPSGALSLGRESEDKAFVELRELTWGFFSNLAQGMRADLVSYLPYNMPPLLNAIQSETVEKSEGLNLFDTDAERMGGARVHDSCVDEKTAAIEAVSSFARYIGNDFAKFVAPCLNVVQDEIMNFHPAVKKAVVKCFEELLLAMYAVHFPKGSEKVWAHGEPGGELPDFLNDVIDAIVPAWTTVMEIDSNGSVVVAACLALKTALGAIGPRLLVGNQENLARLYNIVETLVRKEAFCQKVSEDLGEEDDRFDHLEIFDAAIECVTGCAKILGLNFSGKFLAGLMPTLVKYCQPSQTTTFRTVAVGCVGEVLLHVPQVVSSRDAEALYSIIAACLQVDDVTSGSPLEKENMVNNAAYTIGVVCEIFADALSPMYDSTFNVINTLRGNEACRDNALGSLGRMVRACLNGRASTTSLDDAALMLITSLPLGSDKEPYTTIIPVCLRLLEKQPALAKSQGQRLALAFVDALYTHDQLQSEATAIDPAEWELPSNILSMCVSTIHTLHKTDSDGFNKAISTLDEEVRSFVQKL
eukprot:CAMPEP_0119119084 /NCGR_PEP_ID=MMETSP1310-20130426/728_1 /TAXON_ID=464262 /ORGANISM="Genus nov. species nov., Strain RCC2339" /LENGTH=1101 /DNA_ID=CAMNT_0007108499 /DNA_START=36 /DNA_END=3341 /DNA_ORIENTATION=-